MERVAAHEIKSYSQLKDLVQEVDPDTAPLLIRLHAASAGQPVPFRLEIEKPQLWRIYWQLAPKLTVCVVRASSDHKSVIFVSSVNDKNLMSHSPRELEEQLFEKILARRLRIYNRAQWMITELGPLNSYLEWSAAWTHACVGQKLVIYLRDDDQILFSYELGTDMPMDLQGETTYSHAVILLREYIQAFLIDQKSKPTV